MSEPLAERGVTSPARVVSGLGYPNNRAEASAHPTGWQASVVSATGTPDQEQATIEKIQK